MLSKAIATEQLDWGWVSGPDGARVTITRDAHTEFHLGDCARTVGPRGGVREQSDRYRRASRTKTWKRAPERFLFTVRKGIAGWTIPITEGDSARWHTEADCPLNGEPACHACGEPIRPTQALEASGTLAYHADCKHRADAAFTMALLAGPYRLPEEQAAFDAGLAAQQRESGGRFEIVLPDPR